LVARVTILNDSPAVHLADCIKNVLCFSGWLVLQHAHSSFDLTLCDYDLIPNLKQLLHQKWFAWVVF